MRRVPALALLALLLAVPAARADPPVLGVDPFRAPLAPTPEGHVVQVTVDAPCGKDVALGSRDAPRWLTVAFDPPTLASPPCEGRFQDAVATTVRVAENAPALEAATARLVATSGDEEGHVDLPVAVAFVNELVVVANETERVEKPQGVGMYPLVITNRGNGAARVSFELVQQPRAAQVPLPPPLTIAPGQTFQTQVMAQTPYRNGNMDETDVFAVRIASAAALDPMQEGDDEVLTFTLHTRGYYAPGPALVPVLALLAGLALARRR